MSAVGVAFIAVVMAGVVWYERFVVSRFARRRSNDRRLLRLWASAELCVPDDGPSRRLAASIERAVHAADLAASYEVRWREEAKRGESPFQLRRGRMQAATQRYTTLLDTVAEHAALWLDGMHDRDPWHRQRLHSIEAVAFHLAARTRDGVLSDLAALDATIDVLENALVNLCAHRSASSMDPHPFR